jgi:hypothetical protein
MKTNCAGWRGAPGAEGYQTAPTRPEGNRLRRVCLGRSERNTWSMAILRSGSTKPMPSCRENAPMGNVPHRD